MDFQLIFFLALASLFLIKGIFSLNILAQLMGITILLFLIYNYYFNYGEKKKYENAPKGSLDFFGMIGFLGHIDLVLGILILINVWLNIIPFFLMSFFAILLLIKSVPFVFGGDIASILDVLFAIVIFISGATIIPSFVFIGIAVYLIQKGLFSYFA